jgi:hypothetical protein
MDDIGEIMEQTEQQSIPFGTKLAIWGKFTFVGLVTALTIQGAVSMTQKDWVQVAMGSQAMASERTVKQSLTVEPDYIDSKAVAVPQDLEPIKIELTDSEKAGLAKCKKTKPVSYCNGLWGA